MTKKHKMNAERTTIGDITFASKVEASRYFYLKQLENMGEIQSLELQPVYQITINNIKICKVILDFRYYKNNELIIEDVKGFDPPLSRLKRKLVEAQYFIKVNIIK